VFKNVDRLAMQQTFESLQAIDIVRILPDMSNDKVRSIEAGICNNETGFT